MGVGVEPLWLLKLSVCRNACLKLDHFTVSVYRVAVHRYGIAQSLCFLNVVGACGQFYGLASAVLEVKRAIRRF